MKKLNNKGFSLVELIIVIAIMVILVAVLAPQFTKYVERSRIGTDIQTASEIATAVEVAIADGTITGDVTSTEVKAVDFDSISADPVVKNTTVTGVFKYTVDDNKVTVYIDTTEVYPNLDSSLANKLE